MRSKVIIALALTNLVTLGLLFSGMGSDLVATNRIGGHRMPAEPIVVTVEKTVPSPPEEHVITKYIYETRTEVQYVRLELRYFESEQEFRDWLGVLMLPPEFDCDDYAERTFERALKDGYIVWPAPVYKGKLYGERVYPSNERHVGVWTWIGNEFYYGEPQTGEVIKLENTWRD